MESFLIEEKETSCKELEGFPYYSEWFLFKV